MNCKKGPAIGRGATATVSIATTSSGDLFAVKSTTLSTSKSLQKEQHFLSQLSSPNVIKYIGFDIDYIDNVPMYNLFMEYASGGSISDAIKKNGGFLDEGLIRSYTHQILLGLDYIHSKNLVHCDIKCENLLIAGDFVKIGDLGCVKRVAKGGNFDDFAEFGFSGTPVFMAPEVARGEKQGFESDVWSVGCAVIEMVSGCNPWPEVKNPVAGLYKIGFSGEVPVVPASLSPEGIDFLEKCLRVNGGERWTVKELLGHPFVSLDSGIEKVEGFRRDSSSPRAILDHGFWDSLESSESSPAETRVVEFSGESPVERMRQLGGSCSPNWVDEEDWIMVRVNEEMEESLMISQEDLVMDLDLEDDDTESTWSGSVLFSDLYVEELDELSSSIGMMLGSNVVVSRFLEFKNMNNNDDCFLIDSSLTFALLGDSDSFEMCFNGNLNVHFALIILFIPRLFWDIRGLIWFILDLFMEVANGYNYVHCSYLCMDSGYPNQL